jgi:hypothetical protein
MSRGLSSGAHPRGPVGTPPAAPGRFAHPAPSARRQSGLPHDEALDRRDENHQHRHDQDIARCRGRQPARGEIRLEAVVQGETTNDMLVEVISPVIEPIAGPISFGDKAICLLLGRRLLFIQRKTYTP